MKGVVILLGLFVVIATADKDCPLEKALEKGFEECKESLNPSEEVLKLVAEDKGSDNREVTCFQACMATKAGLMNGPKFDIEKMESILRSAEDPKEEFIKHLIDMMTACRDEGAEESDDECEVAGNYMRCADAKREST